MSTTYYYTKRFYSGQRNRSRSSAEAILPPIIEAVRPGSVVDAGCGVGTWLSVALDASIEDVLGLDGAWVQPGSLEIPAERFQTVDLCQPAPIDRRFDLALCMETGEHLPLECAAGLVSYLVDLAPVVLFSAAVPGQGGTDHVNEQWPDFWADLFAGHGYECVDAVRWRHWTDEDVEFWYAQNSFLYVAPDQAPLDLDAPVGIPFRIVHPGNLERRLDPRHVPWRLAVAALRCRARGAVQKATRRLKRHD